MEDMIQRLEKTWSEMDKDTREIIAEAMFVPLVQRVKDLMEENAELREALGFYANSDHWEPPYANPGENPFSVMDEDQGVKARFTLAELTALKEK